MKRKSLFWLVAAMAAIGTMTWTPSASAQSTDKTTTVLDRPRPELDPLGIRLGAFNFFPKIGVAVTSDDNIFRTATGEVDDIITTVLPSLALSSDWNRHALSLNANAKIGRYADRNTEDFEDYMLGARGRVDVTRRSNFGLGASYAKQHEDRSSPDDTTSVNPTEYSLLKGNVDFNQRFNRLRASIGTDISRYDYDNGSTSTGTAVTNNDRDRDEVTGYVRMGYEITPSYEAFVKLSANDRSYDQRLDDAGVQRDSNGYQGVAGARLDLGGVTFGDVFVGYGKQTYAQSTFSDISYLSYGAALTWNATQLTTAKVGVERGVDETTQSGVSGVLATSYDISVDHELLRNVLIGAKAGWKNSDFRGSTREDDSATASLYGKYMLSRYVYFSAGYDYIKRDSNAAASDFTNNRFMVKLEGQL